MTKRDEKDYVLRCDECGDTTTDGTGWKAALAVGGEDAEDVQEVAVFCPECAEREFAD
jgi:hypothetical protein